MKLEQLPAVEPHWPYGTVAHFYVKRGVAVKDIGIRELAVLEVTQIEGGYRITAGLMPNQYDPHDRRFVFEVDKDGESAECVPWDDDLEADYNPGPRRGVTISPLEDRVLVSDPPSPLEDVEVWDDFEAAEKGGWTVQPSGPPAHDVLDDESQEGVVHNDRR